MRNQENFREMQKNKSLRNLFVDKSLRNGISIFLLGMDHESVGKCYFPEWLIGEYDSLQITQRSLIYSPNIADSIPTISHCFNIDEHGIVVFSESLWYIIL